MSESLDRQQWREYYDEHGPEAYRYRRLYEAVVKQIVHLYEYAEEQGITLPSPDNPPIKPKVEHEP